MLKVCVNLLSGALHNAKLKTSSCREPRNYEVRKQIIAVSRGKYYIIKGANLPLEVENIYYTGKTVGMGIVEVVKKAEVRACVKKNIIRSLQNLKDKNVYC